MPPVVLRLDASTSSDLRHAKIMTSVARARRDIVCRILRDLAIFYHKPGSDLDPEIPDRECHRTWARDPAGRDDRQGRDA